MTDKELAVRVNGLVRDLQHVATITNPAAFTEVLVLALQATEREEREACARLVEQTAVMHFLPAETRAELAAIVRSGEPL